MEEEGEDEVVIAELGSHEQMRALAAVGRLQPVASLSYLKHLLLAPVPPGDAGGEGGGGGCLPRLHGLMTSAGGGKEGWTEAGVAALMEEVRVVVQVGRGGGRDVVVVVGVGGKGGMMDG